MMNQGTRPGRLVGSPASTQNHSLPLTQRLFMFSYHIFRQLLYKVSQNSRLFLSVGNSVMVGGKQEEPC